MLKACFLLPYPPRTLHRHLRGPDLSAAKHADVLFVKNDKPAGENDLAKYVEREGIPHVLFKEFSEALPIVQKIVGRQVTVDEVLTSTGRPDLEGAAAAGGI